MHGHNVRLGSWLRVYRLGLSFLGLGFEFWSLAVSIFNAWGTADNYEGAVGIS